MLSTDVTHSDEPVTELGQTGAMLLAELESAYDAKAEAEARIERVRGAFQVLIGDAHEARVDGQPVITWRPQVSQRFDQATAKRFLTAEQIEACMKPSGSRPFRRVGQ